MHCITILLFSFNNPITDLLVGGDGNDELTGGPGADRFQYGAGKNKITDFRASEGDKKTNGCEQF
jgi:Ca2+-binding RTX toxin-like protein